MILALNICLMAAVFSAVVGSLAWAILSSSRTRHVLPARRSSVSRPAHAWLTPGYGSVSRANG